jgi:hypothetical protein
MLLLVRIKDYTVSININDRAFKFKTHFPAFWIVILIILEGITFLAFKGM